MPRVGLTRGAVIHAAVVAADARGLRAVTMRALAADLDVEAMSLYNHVANKEDVLKGLVGALWSEADLAEDESDWRIALHRLCGSAHGAMLRHPWFFELPVTYGGLEQVRVIQAILALLDRGGIAEAAAFHGLHVIEGHLYGYSWQAIGFADIDATDDASRQILSRIDAAQFPQLLAHARRHANPPAGDGFHFGLDLILDGLTAAPTPH